MISSNWIAAALMGIALLSNIPKSNSLRQRIEGVEAGFMDVSSFRRGLQDDKNCSCNPSTNAWEINTDFTCKDNLYDEEGIDAVYCQIDGPAGEPEYIANVTVYEGDGTQYINAVSQDPSFRFNTTNVIVDKSKVVEGGDVIIKSYRIEATGVLADGSEQNMTAHIFFTNKCLGKPVFNDGDTFAWFQFNVHFSEDVVDEYCPLDKSTDTGTNTGQSSDTGTNIGQSSDTGTNTGSEKECLNVGIQTCQFEFDGKTYGCDEWSETKFGCEHDIDLKYIISYREPNNQNVLIISGTGPFENVYLDEEGGIQGLVGKSFDPQNDIFQGSHVIEGLDLCSLDMDISIMIESEYETGLPIKGPCYVEEASVTIPSPDQSPEPTPSKNPTSPAPTNSPNAGEAPGKGKGGKGKGGKGKGGKGKGAKSCKSTGKTNGGKGAMVSKSSKSCSYYEYECKFGVTKSPKSSKGNRLERRAKLVVPSKTSDPSSNETNDSKIVTKPPPITANRILSMRQLSVADETSEVCKECYDLMGSDVDVPQDAKEKGISYQVKIVTTSNENELPDSKVKEMFLDTMNGFFKAELLGCNFPSSRRRLDAGESVDLLTADFDDLSFEGGADEGVCDDSSEGENCRGTTGSLQVSYTGDDSDEKVAEAVNVMLDDNADQISSIVNEFESVEFRMVSSKQASILPKRSLLSAAWLIPFFAAGCALVIYGAFVLVRDKKGKDTKDVTYAHVGDETKADLFETNDKLRSDNAVQFPIKAQKWSGIQFPVNNYQDDTIQYNSESLAQKSFVIPSIDDHEEEDEPLQVETSTFAEVDEFGFPAETEMTTIIEVDELGFPVEE